MLLGQYFSSTMIQHDSTVIASNAYIGLNLIEVDLIGRIVDKRRDRLNNHSCLDAGIERLKRQRKESEEEEKRTRRKPVSEAQGCGGKIEAGMA